MRTVYLRLSLLRAMQPLGGPADPDASSSSVGKVEHGASAAVGGASIHPSTVHLLIVLHFAIQYIKMYNFVEHDVVVLPYSAGLQTRHYFSET
jgi:hypothetical protein